MPGQIVIINGTSGSGKSTACETFVRRTGDFWMLYGIDHFIANTLPAQFCQHGPRAREGIYAHPRDPDNPEGPLRWGLGPHGVRAFNTLHDWIAAASRNGCNLIFDHILMSDLPVLADCAWRLQGLPALLVTLKPPYEVLEKRVAQRRMDKKLPIDILGADAAQKIVDRLARLRPWFYESIYANDITDLEIDTSRHGPDEVAGMILARLAEGPGTAFARLRQNLACP